MSGAKLASGSSTATSRPGAHRAHDLSQVVGWLEHAHGVRFGELASADPFQGVRVRVGHDSHLGFDSGQAKLSLASAPEAEEPTGLESLATVRLGCPQFALGGADSPLPAYLLEQLAWDGDGSGGDSALAPLLDLLQHRLLGFAARAHLDSHFDAPGRDPDSGTTPWQRLLAICERTLGWGAASTPGALDGVVESKEGFERRLRLALGVLLDVPKCETGDVVKLDIEPYVGGWEPLETDSRWCLGASAHLGQDTTVGSWAFMPQLAVRVSLGPLSERTLLQALAAAASFEKTRSDQQGDCITTQSLQVYWCFRVLQPTAESGWRLAGGDPDVGREAKAGYLGLTTLLPATDSRTIPSAIRTVRATSSSLWRWNNTGILPACN